MVAMDFHWGDFVSSRPGCLGRAWSTPAATAGPPRGPGRWLNRMGANRYAASDFTLVYDDFAPEDEGLREALTSTGNGYFCVRGSAEWEDPSDVHYPGAYAHGVYNRESTIIAGLPVHNEDLVNLPRLGLLRLCLEGEEPIGLANVEVLSYRHVYDLRYAMLTRELCFRDRAGRETSLRSRRFVSMGRMHLAAVDWQLAAENWSGRAEVISGLDGRVLNRGVARYQQLWGRHLDPQGPRIDSPM
jgi:alpha,alpha-trehalase